MNIVRRLFSTSYMVKAHARKGNIPTTRIAYTNSLRIAIPAVIEMVSIALMDMIDTMMVGRVSPQAMTAVGITGQPRMLVLSLFFALNVALTAIIARKKGAGEMGDARKCLRHGLLINFIMGLKFTLLAIIFAQPLLRLAGAQPDTINEATSYFQITNLVLIPQIMTMTICVAQRAIGNTKVALKVNVTAKIVSVLLNFLLIEGRLGFPRMEVDGVAVARSIAALVAFSLALASILHKDSPLRISLRDNWKFERPMIGSISKLTSGGLLEQVSLRFGFFAYARVIADLGTNAFAAHIIAMQLMILSFTFAEGIGAATTSLVGQNLGKGRPDLSSMYGKIGMRLAILCAIFLSAICIVFRFQFAAIFTDYHDIVITAGGLILILAFILPLQTTQLVMGGSLRGAGDTKYVALTMFIAVGVMRPLFGFIMVVPLGLGLTGAWLAMFFDQSARLVMLFSRFVRGKWMDTKLEKSKDEKSEKKFNKKNLLQMILLPISMLFIGFLVSTSTSVDELTVRGAGFRSTRTFEIGEFDGISISGNFTVIYTSSAKHNATITMQSNLFSYTTVEEIGGILRIESSMNFETSERNTPRVYIYAPQLYTISLHRDVTALDWDNVQASNIIMYVSGNSYANMYVQAYAMDIRATGDATIVLGGSVDIAYVTVMGESAVHAFSLLANEADVYINDYGFVEITALDSLLVEIYGSGNVIYRGTPHVEYIIDGNGKVIGDTHE